MAGFLMNVGKAGEVAERSPAVISANLKEDMLLDKKITVLNRSERSVVHQIKVDQKVLYKRFQSRLVRSKLAFARIMGQKDTEKALRSKNLGILNTDIVGQSDEEYSFLNKLEHRPCTAPCLTPQVSFVCRTRGAKVSRKKTKPDKTNDEDTRASSAKARLQNMSDFTGEVINKEKRSGKLRPATTTGLRLSTSMLLQNRQKAGNMSPIPEHVDVLTEPSVNNEHEQKNADDSSQCHGGENNNTSEHSESTHKGNDNEHLQETDEKNDFDEDKDKSEATETDANFLEKLDLEQRPQTVECMQPLEEESPLTSPKLSTRRASRATDFFHEEKKIDLVALRLKEAKSKDYAERIQTFYDDIEEMVNDPNRPQIDYYATRLETSMADRMCTPLTEVPGTPEDENKRSIGNIFVRSLTVPVINQNY